MMATDEMLHVLIEGFEQLDFKQPKAHRVYEELLIAMNDIITDVNYCSWHEFYLWQLGAAYNSAAEKRDTIPPLSVHKESKTEKSP
jgi:hypothetical protein